MAGQRIVGKRQIDVLHHQHLSGKRQTYACARGLGGEEGDEYLASHVGWDGKSIIADVDGVGAAISNVDDGSPCLDCIFHEIDEYLAQHILVSIYRGIFGE